MKKRLFKTFFLIVVIFFNQKVFSQKLMSNLEEKFFSLYEKDSLRYNFFYGMSIIDSTYTEMRITSYQLELDNFINSLPTREQESKEQKRVKKIYDLVQSKYFKKYEMQSHFTDVFYSGNYNSVSATALYVYIFDKLNIPYHVKELPSHVYLIAYPYTYKIQIETTIPGVATGFFVPQESEVIKSVDYLVEMKLVNQADVKAKGYAKVYNDYFYGDKYLDKNNLIGMQYYNKALFDYVDNKNIYSALGNIVKSMQFYVNPSSEAILKELLLNAISDDKIDNKENVGLLLKAIQKIKLDRNMDKSFIEYLLNSLYGNNDVDLPFIESFIPEYEKIKDEKLKNICLVETLEYLIGHYSEKLYYEKGLEFSDKLLSIDSKSKYAKEGIIYNMVNLASKNPLNEENYLKFNEICETHPFTRDDKRVISVEVIYCANLSENFFGKRDEENGLKYFEKFEKVLNEKKELVEVNSENIAQFYLMVGRFYYGQSKFKQALEIFQRGLNYYPNNSELEKMAKWAKEDMD